MSQSRTARVHVLVVNWNGRHHLEVCMPSLLQTKWGDFEAVVLDNGSSDGSQALVRECYPQAQLIELQGNLGFTGASNAGIKLAIAEGADYVVLLNNDTRVEPEWLSYLVDVADTNPVVFACQSRQLTWQGDQEIRLAFFPEYAAGGNALVPVSVGSEPFPTPYAAGCCMLMRTSMLKHIGLFDPRYFAYVEDLDLCLRAWIAGYSVVCVPSSIIYHRVGGSSASQQGFWGYRNQLTTLLKNYEWKTLQTFRRAILRRWLLTRYPVALRATMAAIALLPGTVARRRRVQSLRVRSDAEVFARMGVTAISEQ